MAITITAKSLLSPCYAPSTVLSILQILIYLILTEIALNEDCYHPNFTDIETEAQGGCHLPKVSQLSDQATT